MGMHRTLINRYLRQAREAAPAVDDVADTAGQVAFLEGLLDDIADQMKGWDVESMSAEGTSSTTRRASSLTTQANALEKAIELAAQGRTEIRGTIVIPILTATPTN